jgi:hypothetical protein
MSDGTVYVTASLVELCCPLEGFALLWYSARQAAFCVLLVCALCVLISCTAECAAHMQAGRPINICWQAGGLPETHGSYERVGLRSSCCSGLGGSAENT